MRKEKDNSFKKRKKEYRISTVRILFNRDILDSFPFRQVSRQGWLLSPPLFNTDWRSWTRYY